MIKGKLSSPLTGGFWEGAEKVRHYPRESSSLWQGKFVTVSGIVPI
ncbi:hypothetical protein [Bacteroides sp.]